MMCHNSHHYPSSHQFMTLDMCVEFTNSVRLRFTICGCLDTYWLNFSWNYGDAEWYRMSMLIPTIMKRFP